MIFQGFEAPRVDAPHDKTLAVFIHGAHKTRASRNDLIRVAREALGDAIAIYAPDLPYANRLDTTGAGPIVASLVAFLDELWRTHGPYDRVVFIGHSMGGALLRRVFLAGSPRPPDYDAVFAFRDDLPGGVSRKATDHPWAARVERLVLIATWDKGWSLSERVGLEILVRAQSARFPRPYLADQIESRRHIVRHARGARPSSSRRVFCGWPTSAGATQSAGSRRWTGTRIRRPGASIPSLCN